MTKGMTRRNAVASLGALAALGLAAAPRRAAAQIASAERANAIAVWRDRIVAILGRGRLPIIDVQATYIANQTNAAKIIGQMNDLDVAQIVFAAAAAPDSSPSFDLHRANRAHIVPASNSGEFPRWWTGPEKFVDGLARDLATGRYFMMGEHEFRHYPSPEQVDAGLTQRDITIDITGPAGQALFKLSEETGIAFQIHYEIEDRLLPALETMLVRHPDAKVIWCHLAMIRYPDRSTIYGPAYVSGLIEKHPGLHFDLASPPGHNIYKPSGARDGTLFEPGSPSLRAEWKAVLEKYSDRFLAASDYRPPVEQNYPRAIGHQRNILEQLNADARQRIAFKNAWRLITGTAWV